jgi:glycosyltransferase involved in cell wall biosynthesis
VHTISHPAIVRYAQIAQERRLAPAGSSRPFTVLLFGRIFAYKGLGTLVRAEALLTERLRDLRIVIAGRGDDPKTFRSEMGAPQRYDIRHRYIDDGEVAQLFLDADLVVLPYSEASQSGVLHVAGSFGKPVVATDVGELGSTVREQNLGLVVAPSDPASLAEAIAFLAERPGVRASLGASARAFAEGVNAPDAVGAAAAELYRRVSEPGRSDVR